jgi:uncharacterized protein YlzI (FlbEa/FlbD family)
MIKINNRNEGLVWINHRHIVSLCKYQAHPTLFVTRIIMSNGYIFNAEEDLSIVLNRIEDAKQKEREVK